jgi:hypothetical protein
VRQFGILLFKKTRLNGPSIIELFINDNRVREVDIKATVYGAFTADETFDIGRDEGLTVNREYEDKGKLKIHHGPATQCDH